MDKGGLDVGPGVSVVGAGTGVGPGVSVVGALGGNKEARQSMELISESLEDEEDEEDDDEDEK